MAPAETAPASTRRVGPVRVLVRNRDQALREIVQAIERRQRLHVAFANTHLVYCALRQPRFRDVLRDFYTLNDGVGLSVLARIADGAGFPDNLNGTDFTPHLLEAAPAGTKVFLVGAAPGVAQKVALEIQRRYRGLTVAGAFDGYSARADARDRVLDEVRREQPHLVLVAMGNPLQELWIREAAEAAPQAVMIGVGALFDFMANVVERAPPGWRRLRLEWLFRLLREPRRLAKRYSYEVAALLLHCARQRLFPERGHPS